MTDTLILRSSSLAGVRPELDYNQQLTGLKLDLNLSYGPGVGKMVTIDAWALLSDEQKNNMQNIQDTISAYIQETYFA